MARAILTISAGASGSAPFAAGHARHAGALHRLLRAHLVAHEADGFGPRTDEHETAPLDLVGEVRVLGQEAVAGVDGLGVRDLGRADDGRDVEVALAEDGGGPMQTDSSARRTYLASRSASECTTTVLMPSSRQARWTRSAISPRLAIRIFSNMGASAGGAVSGSAGRSTHGAASGVPGPPER